MGSFSDYLSRFPEVMLLLKHCQDGKKGQSHAPIQQCVGVWRSRLGHRCVTIVTIRLSQGPYRGAWHPRSAYNRQEWHGQSRHLVDGEQTHPFGFRALAQPVLAGPSPTKIGLACRSWLLKDRTTTLPALNGTVGSKGPLSPFVIS